MFSYGQKHFRRALIETMPLWTELHQSYEGRCYWWRASKFCWKFTQTQSYLCLDWWVSDWETEYPWFPWGSTYFFHLWSYCYGVVALKISIPEFLYIMLAFSCVAITHLDNRIGTKINNIFIGVLLSGWIRLYVCLENNKLVHILLIIKINDGLKNNCTLYKVI